MGLFAEYQPQDAAHGIATFPVRFEGKDKKPAIKGYLTVGPDLSRRHAEKFAAYDAFGLALGKRNGIAVLDVDTPDERKLADALDRHGATPFVVRSGSGNYQAWYRHNGERRHVRPWPDKPIDVLGAGYVVAPPSRGVRRQYQIVQGALDDLDHLPVMRGLEGLAEASQRAASAYSGIEPTGYKPWGEMRDGDGRNRALMLYVGQAARSCDTQEQLLDRALARNAECGEPLPFVDVLKVVTYWWRQTERNLNWCGLGQETNRLLVLAASDPFAHALYWILHSYHQHRDEFYIAAKAMAERLGWTIARFRAARNRLERDGFIRCISPGGRGPNDPAIYAWAKG